MNHKEAIESGAVAIHDPEGKNLTAIVAFFSALGLRIYEDIGDSGDFKEYPYVVYYNNHLVRATTWSVPVTNSKEQLAFGEFLSRESFEYKPAFVVVPLNVKYTAIVSKDKINVGCQEFDISILDKLVEARKSLS